MQSVSIFAAVGVPDMKGALFHVRHVPSYHRDVATMSLWRARWLRRRCLTYENDFSKRVTPCGTAKTVEKVTKRNSHNVGNAAPILVA
jgi:hypothetical protein